MGGGARADSSGGGGAPHMGGGAPRGHPADTLAVEIRARYGVNVSSARVELHPAKSVSYGPRVIGWKIMLLLI